MVKGSSADILPWAFTGLTPARETLYRDIMPIRPPLAQLPGPPIQPGWYWFKSTLALREMMFEVRLIDGELHLMKFYADNMPVKDAKGSWRGPLKPSTGPGSR